MTDGDFDDRQQSVIPATDEGHMMTPEGPLIRDVTLHLENGLHLVPCSRIVGFVRDFPGDVTIRFDEQAVDAKSIFDLLTLRAPFGSILTLEVSGTGSAEMIDGLEALFERNFEPE